jgi:cytochrome c-type biogenesis protein CcmH
VPERLRRLAFPALVAVLGGIVVLGLLLAEPREVDRVEALASELRCPVCQSESVADSPSQTARDMQARIAELVEAGHTDEEIVDYFVARYGEWVRLDPPMRGRTALLWLLPVGGAALGVATVLHVAGHRRRPAAEVTDEGRAAVAAALAEIADEDPDP